MSEVIFGDMFSFPEGEAATNRVLTFAKGFHEHGVNVHVICFGNEYTTEGDGVYNGIYYYHPFRQVTRHKYFIVRRIQKLVKYFRTAALIKRLNDAERIESVTILTNMFGTQLYAWFLTRIFRTKLVTECSEHPLRHFQHGLLKQTWGKVKFYFESRLCDGIYCISRYLMDYHREHGIDHSRLLLVPSTVDPSRFEVKGPSPFPFNYVGYFGALTFWRDNVDLLIRAYAAVCSKHQDINLVLGGFGSDEERKQITDLASELKISERVILLDYLKRDEILTYITHAYVLVMVRSNNLDAVASYPSKLTEYVATEKPVITVNVGEVTDFYTDGRNAWVVEPENVPAMTEKLDYVLSNYNMALEVSARGKELIMTTFNYHYQAKRMLDFVASLKK
jgi:glycosyltransferase involved in cell wall biosynthesis